MPHINFTVLSTAADAFELTFVAEHYALLGNTKSFELEARIYSFAPLLQLLHCNAATPFTQRSAFLLTASQGVIAHKASL